jgi:hypothetical protein
VLEQMGQWYGFHYHILYGTARADNVGIITSVALTFNYTFIWINLKSVRNCLGHITMRQHYLRWIVYLKFEGPRGSENVTNYIPIMAAMLWQSSKYCFVKCCRNIHTHHSLQSVIRFVAYLQPCTDVWYPTGELSSLLLKKTLINEGLLEHACISLLPVT